MEKYKNFKTQKRIFEKNDFETKLLNNSFYGKRMENIQSRKRLEFFKKDNNEKINKQQAKLTINRIHKFNTL